VLPHNTPINKFYTKLQKDFYEHTFFLSINYFYKKGLDDGDFFLLKHEPEACLSGMVHVSNFISLYT